VELLHSHIALDEIMVMFIVVSEHGHGTEKNTFPMYEPLLTHTEYDWPHSTLKPNGLPST
jgi:hypothetical protein